MRPGDHPYFDAPFLALAHRGGSLHPDNLGRENSRHAFATAVRLGYTHVETDVHATQDGVLVAFHDDRLDRATDARGAINELPWSAVRRARIAGIDPIPTLAELLEEFAGLRFNIDIKAAGAVEPLARTLAEHRAESRVCVGSFSQRRLGRFRRLAPRVATSVGRLGVGWTALVPGLPRLLPARGSALQIPISWPIGGREVSLVNRRTLARAHAGGRLVHVWTVDDRAEMERLIELGVDGLVTDAIDVLREVLIERGLWFGQEAS